MTDIKKLDLYDLLSVSIDSTEQEIKSSYRRLALSCHPDKNPDNPEAIERFHQLSKALEILTDSTAKSAYDKLLRARKANVLRHRKLDQKRQKLKDELEAREKAAKDDNISEAEASDRLQREIDRLRKEGSKQLETENQLLRQKIEEEIRLNVELNLIESQCLPKIKVIKKSKSFDFNETNLRQQLSSFGEINCFVLTKNQKKALIEFNDYEQAFRAFQSRQQLQHLFSIEWIGDKPEPKQQSFVTIDEPEEPTNRWSDNTFVEQNSGLNSDYESLVLMKLRKAEERKQLNKQLEQQN